MDGTLDEAAELVLHGGLWKLPEPWTRRARPPLLGKRTERVSHSFHRPLLSSVLVRTSRTGKWYKGVETKQTLEVVEVLEALPRVTVEAMEGVEARHSD
jgi:hypothetical protein